jgi:hypothetical protein
MPGLYFQKWINEVPHFFRILTPIQTHVLFLLLFIQFVWAGTTCIHLETKTRNLLTSP